MELSKADEAARSSLFQRVGQIAKTGSRDPRQRGGDPTDYVPETNAQRAMRRTPVRQAAGLPMDPAAVRARAAYQGEGDDMNNALDKMLKGFDADLTKIEKGQFKPGDSSEQPGVTQESPDSSWSMIESFLEKMIADLGALLASSAEADAERSSGEAPTTPVTMGKMTNDRTRMVQLIKRARVLKQTDGIGDFLTRAGKAYKTDDRKLAKARESEPKASPQPPLAFGR